MSPAFVAIALVFALLVGSSAAHAEIGVMGFQAWKSGRIDEARSILERVQMEIQLDKAPSVERAPGLPGALGKDAKAPHGEAARAPKGQRPEQRLDQAKLNVELNQELTIQDYFVLYLSQFKNRDAFLEAAKKLSPDEMAEIMMAYKKEIGPGTAQDDIPMGLGSTTVVPLNKQQKP
jgi:hypothetical protein